MAVESRQPEIMDDDNDGDDEPLGEASAAELTERTEVPSLREERRG